MSWQPDQDLSADLLAAFQSRFGISATSTTPTAVSTNTKVLDSAQYVAEQAIDVFINREGLLSAAAQLAKSIKARPFSTKSWTEHELHPDPEDGSMSEADVVRFIFTMDLLNFCFWSEGGRGFEVEWKGRKWSGYWSLVAGLRRAVEEGVPITDPEFWRSGRLGMGTMRYVFGNEEMGRRKPRWMRRREERVKEGFEGNAAEESKPVEEKTSNHNDGMQGEGLTVSSEGADKANEAPREHVRDTEDVSMHKNKPFEPKHSRNSEKVTETQIESGDTGIDESHSHAQTPDQRIEETDDDDKVDEGQNEPREPGMPLLRERLGCLKEAAQVLSEKYDGDVLNLIKAADKSAGRLVNLLAQDFDCFDDKHVYEGYKIRFYKRAQIFVADLWACFQGRAGSPGEFHDIDNITAFADYRIPQMLHTWGVISYSPPLDAKIRRKEIIESGNSWEVQLRGCSVWAVEILKREIVAQISASSDEQGEAADPADNNATSVNAILLDFHLYDSVKALEANTNALIQEERAKGNITTSNIIPHHRTKSIWY